MRKFVLCALGVLGCAGTTRSVIKPVDRIILQDADACVFLVRDPASGTITPLKRYAERVRIVFDVLPGDASWVEYIDAPGEFRGEGDRLILHVRSMEDIAY
jgi:hypothetical protein